MLIIKEPKKLKCASFFAGVGGIDIGFEGFGANKSDVYEIVYANEIDEYPIKTYELNSSLKVDHRDIKDVVINMESVPDFDVLLAGFPCQAFSIAGYRQGFNDEKGRGTLFFELLKIIRAKQPSIIFLENVKNLLTHNHGDTFNTIIDALEKEGYSKPHYKVLNAMDYGNVPQNRERIYIVAFKDPDVSAKFKFPDPIPLTSKLSDVIEFECQVDKKYYYTEDRYKENICRELSQTVTSVDTVYQWRRHYVRTNMSGVVPTLTANMGEGGHNVPIILGKHGIRKLTPHECFNVQGFPKDFRLPDSMAESRIYKQAGNSVCVSVISRIAENIFTAIDENETNLTLVVNSGATEFSKQKIAKSF